MPARGNAKARLGGGQRVDFEFKIVVRYMSAIGSKEAESIIAQRLTHSQMHTGAGECASGNGKVNWFPIIYTGSDGQVLDSRARPCMRGIAPLSSLHPTIIP